MSEVMARPMPGRRLVPVREWWVRTAGAVLEVGTELHATGPVGGGVRGEVRAWSSASRRRLFRALAAIPWPLLGPCLFVTLTYPSAFPTSGRVVHHHLDRLHRSIERRWGKACGVWKLEFQRRGAPHFHLCLVSPVRCVCGAYGQRQGSPKHRSCGCQREFREWLSAEWFRIVGSGDVAHLSAGTSVEWLGDHPASYLAGYVSGYGGKGKGHQEVVPESALDVGRWGGFWALSPEWRAVRVTERDWYQLRRLMRRWARSVGLHGPGLDRPYTEWVHCRGRSAAVVLYQLSRALSCGGLAP